MTKREQFDKDLSFGESRETAFVKAIQDCHVECKSDQKRRKTGHFAIEIRQGEERRPSGLSVTTAKWWAIEYADDCWLVIRTSVLKAITRAWIADFGTVVGGDNKNEMALIPVPELIKACH